MRDFIAHNAKFVVEWGQLVLLILIIFCIVCIYKIVIIQKYSIINKLSKWSVSLFCFFIIIFSILGILGLSYEKPHTLTVLNKFDKIKNQKAPSLSFKNVLDDEEKNIQDYFGNVILVNFWATWCVPCRVEMPSFEKLYRRYRSEGVAVLAVTLDKNSEQKIKSFFDEYRLSFPVLLDEEGKVERLYPSMTIPFTYVIDRDGRVVARVDGAKNWESNETFEAIEYLLKKS